MFRKYLAALAVTTLSFGSAQALTIDTFNTTQSVTDFGGDAIATSGTVSDAANIIGTDRIVTVLQTGGTTAASLSFNDGSNSLMTLSNADSTSTSTILYGGIGGTLGLGGVDVTVSGAQNAFDIRVIQSDFATAVSITVGDASGSSILTQTSPTLVTSSTPFIFEFANFSVFTGSGADFTSLEFIQIDITTSVNQTDLQLDFFGTTTTVQTPEPGMALVFGFGLAALGFARRRRS
jgi:hypothetical protein